MIRERFPEAGGRSRVLQYSMVSLTIQPIQMYNITKEKIMETELCPLCNHLIYLHGDKGCYENVGGGYLCKCSENSRSAYVLSVLFELQEFFSATPDAQYVQRVVNKVLDTLNKENK